MRTGRVDVTSTRWKYRSDPPGAGHHKWHRNSPDTWARRRRTHYNEVRNLFCGPKGALRARAPLRGMHEQNCAPAAHSHRNTHHESRIVRLRVGERIMGYTVAARNSYSSARSSAVFKLDFLHYSKPKRGPTGRNGTTTNSHTRDPVAKFSV